MSNCSKCKSKLIPVGFNPELNKTVDRLYCVSTDLICIDCLINGYKRAEAAEARAADEELRAKSWHDSAMTLADQRDAAYKRNAELEAERDEARSTCERMNEIIKKIATERGDAQQERDEARRQLSEAQHAIDVLSNTVVAQDATIKRLFQQREDVEQYRAEIARLNQAATA